MAYHRFDPSKFEHAPATVATVATVSAADRKTTPPPATAPMRRNRRTVATVATVATDIAVSRTPPDPERTSVLVEVGGVPAAYAEAFVAMMAYRPPDVIDARWCRAIDDAGRFLDAWGTTAAALGWTRADLFERAERGAHGLLWELDGRVVVALAEDVAAIGEGGGTARAWFARPIGRRADAATA